MQDPLTKAKLEFFRTVAREVEPFLTLYQTDQPMLPFITQDMSSLLRRLMERFVKPCVLAEATSTAALVKVDMTNSKNFVDVSKVKVGFSAERQLVKSNLALDRQKGEFRLQCRAYLAAVVKKLLEKAPVTYPLVRNLVCLDPRQIADVNKKEGNAQKMTRILHMLVECNRLKEVKCDQVLIESVRSSHG